MEELRNVCKDNDSLNQVRLERYLKKKRINKSK